MLDLEILERVIQEQGILIMALEILERVIQEQGILIMALETSLHQGILEDRKLVILVRVVLELEMLVTVQVLVIVQEVLVGLREMDITGGKWIMKQKKLRILMT